MCPAPRLLEFEFGPSEFSAMYRWLVPDAEVVIADRPTPPDYIGFTERRCRETLGCAGYIGVELAQFMRAAGLRLEAFCFSGCWDRPGIALPAHRRGNLVFVARRDDIPSP